MEVTPHRRGPRVRRHPGTAKIGPERRQARPSCRLGGRPVHGLGRGGRWRLLARRAPDRAEDAGRAGPHPLARGRVLLRDRGQDGRAARRRDRLRRGRRLGLQAAQPVAHVLEPGDTECRILEIIAPGGFEEFFDELAELVARGGDFSPRSSTAGARKLRARVRPREAMPALTAEHGYSPSQRPRALARLERSNTPWTPAVGAAWKVQGACAVPDWPAPSTPTGRSPRWSFHEGSRRRVGSRRSSGRP